MKSVSVGLSLGGVFVRSLQDRGRRPEAHLLTCQGSRHETQDNINNPFTKMHLAFHF